MSLGDDDDALTGLRDFGKDVRAQDDRVIAGRGELLDELARLDDLLRVEAGGRLVENQHVGVVNQRLREADALLVALRQLAALAIRHVGDARALHHGLDALRAVSRRHAFDLRDERQVFHDAHVGIERRRFRQIAGAALGFDRLVEHVEAGDDGFAVRGRHVAGQDPHRRRLTGAVGAEKSEDFAALDAEADVVDGGDAAVAFGEVLDLDHVGNLFWLQSDRKCYPNHSKMCRARPTAAIAWRTHVCNGWIEGSGFHIDER